VELAPSFHRYFCGTPQKTSIKAVLATKSAIFSDFALLAVHISMPVTLWLNAARKSAHLGPSLHAFHRFNWKRGQFLEKNGCYESTLSAAENLYAQEDVSYYNVPGKVRISPKKTL